MRQSSIPSFAIVLGLVLAFAAGSPSFAGSKWPQEEVASWSFDAAPGGALTVEVSDADLDLRVGSSNAVEIRIFLASRDLDTARARFEKMNFRAEESSGTLSLSSEQVSVKWKNWRDVGFSLRAEISIPERFDVDLVTDDGDVSVQRLEGRLRVRTADGDVALGRVVGPEATLVTSDGDIEVTELNCGTVEIKTSDGDISISDLDGDELLLRTGDGDIAIEHASGALKASTGDGDIQVGLDRFEETSLTTGDGDVAISAASGFAAQLDLRASEVVLRGFGFSGDRSEHEVRGTLNGGGPMLHVSSRDGTVVLNAL